MFSKQPLNKHAGLIVGLLVLAAAPVSAQTFGEITGTVTDPSGAVVTGAGITVTNVATHQIRTVQSNQAGNYTVPFLVPGVYDIHAEMAGFKRAERKGLTLQVSDVARVDFALEVGEITQAVEVTATAALLSTESTATGTVI